MKRIFLLIFLSFVVVFSFVSVYEFRDLKHCKIGEYEQYSIATYLNLGYGNFDIVGDLKIYRFKNIEEVDNECNPMAEMLLYKYEKFEGLKYFESLPCVKEECVDGISFKYLYDKSLPKILSIGNIQFNLQVAFCEDWVKVGYPCIVDSV